MFSGLLALITSVIAVYEITLQHLNPGHSCLWLFVSHGYIGTITWRLRENNAFCIGATLPHQSKHVSTGGVLGLWDLYDIIVIYKMYAVKVQPVWCPCKTYQDMCCSTKELKNWSTFTTPLTSFRKHESIIKENSVVIYTMPFHLLLSLLTKHFF